MTVPVAWTLIEADGRMEEAADRRRGSVVEAGAGRVDDASDARLDVPRSRPGRSDGAGPPLGEAIPETLGDEHVQRALQGDESAFSLLYRHVQPGLVRYLTALVGVDAEDVAAEAWAQVCRDLDGFTGGLDGFRGWVATIGRHRALDHLRMLRRRPVVPMEPGLLPVTGTVVDASDVAEEAEATRAALRMIATLPRDQAEAVLLRVVMGLDAAAAASVLGKRPGAVRTAAHRGLRALARRLDAPQDRTQRRVGRRARRGRSPN
jgi:RNA polymerase sigma-70 factor, ECF subfamily